MIHLHVFCSVEVQAGTASLAFHCARMLSAGGRVPVLIDANLTGSSFVDAFWLRAPEVETRTDGTADLNATTGRHLTRAATVAAVKARSRTPWTPEQTASPPPPFLNDLLGYASGRFGEHGEEEWPVKALLWRHEDDDGVLYLPSSPLWCDIQLVGRWPHMEDFIWIRRMGWLLEGLLEQMPALTDVVFDMPPGLFGFAHETLALTAHMANEAGTVPPGFPPTWGDHRWIGRPWLVTSEHRPALLVAVDYFAANRSRLPTLKVLLNRRRDEDLDAIREAVRDHVGSPVGAEIAGALTASSLDVIREALWPGAGGA